MAVLRRRTFLSGSAGALVLAGCGGGDDVKPAPTPQAKRRPTGAVTIDFADGDVAIVNFAYALEQLEAAFYARANRDTAGRFGRDARRTLAAIGAHEIVHAAFFKQVLGSAAIGTLEPDFSKVDFGDPDSVLETAQAFEDLGVSAYNGAAQFLTGRGKLGLAPLQAAGAIVSVEARHASAIRTLVHGDSSGAFAPAAFDEARLPGQVLEMAAPFLKTTIRLRNAPKQAKT